MYVQHTAFTGLFSLFTYSRCSTDIASGKPKNVSETLQIFVHLKRRTTEKLSLDLLALVAVRGRHLQV